MINLSLFKNKLAILLTIWLLSLFIIGGMLVAAWMVMQ